MHEVCALVDCNSFYVSCERRRNPALNGKPVLVLSNNDGCVVSMSREAKRLGVPMGSPLFKIRDLVERHQMLRFSPDFAFYAQVSREVTSLLKTFSPVVEVYSIDEAFMDLTGIASRDRDGYGRQMRDEILRQTGIPVSVGIAETKTLAKVATHLAKASDKAQGVLDLYASPYRELALRRTAIGEVWGVGRRLSQRLKAQHVITAWDLAQKNVPWARQHYNVMVAQTVAELQGTACLEIHTRFAPPKSIIFSRSFGQLVSSKSLLQEAIASYTRKAAEKLYRAQMAATYLSVYIRTNRFRRDLVQYRNEWTVRLPVATHVSSVLVSTALEALEQIYCPGFAYHKAGIMLHGLIPDNQIQLNLLADNPASAQHDRLEKVVSDLNSRMGSRSVFLGAEGVRPFDWQMRQQFMASPQQDGASHPLQSRLFIRESDAPLRFF